MKDKALIKVALAWSLIGIAVLLFIAEFHEVDSIKIIELGDHMGKIVYVQGNVTKATYTETVTIFDIKDRTGDITVVAFDKMNETIHKGDEIRIFGKVDTYKNELEVIADKIECIRCG